ncbi:MAG: hypothetical protein GY816_12440 [Cytophagales bacterium]|nr:hypothetical protein [Cytophagales bacterium]
MKYLVVIWAISVLLISCGIGKKEIEVYHITNKSSYPLTIKSFLDGDLDNRINIPVEGIWESQELDVTNGGKRSGNGIFILDLGEPDSVLVVFDESKILTYNSRATQPRHLLNFSGNYEITTSENKTIFTYIFTNMDYDNAELISNQ